MLSELSIVPQILARCANPDFPSHAVVGLSVLVHWPLNLSQSEGCLFVRHLGGELGVVLLESVADALLGGHPLQDAAVNAAALAGGDGFGGEVVDAGHEAVLDEAAEGLVGNGCQFLFFLSFPLLFAPLSSCFLKGQGSLGGKGEDIRP